MVIAVTCEEAGYLDAHWLESARRRPAGPCESVVIDSEAGAVRVVTTRDGEGVWRKAVEKELKNVRTEDVGKMSGRNGRSLRDAFNEEGLEKLSKLEKDLRIKVIFRCDGHVLLVGPKSKLQRKSSDVRNLLSHFHWRLSGQDVAFDAATS